ncbi:MAG: class I SAM-dependent methyltransferase [Bradyrhizobium sp.]
MEDGQPSRTAFGAAAHRAAHQIKERGAVFSDPFALAILGQDGDAALERINDSSHRVMRLFIAARSRFSEDALSAAVARGVRQAVILGAGLDTFSLRNPHSRLGLRVYEVDHPATQKWKCNHLRRLGLEMLPSVTLAPVDFERQRLADCLAGVGFQAESPAFFVWLGVVPYLTRQAISTTLEFIGGIPSSEVVFDYSEPLENYDPERRAIVEARAANVASLGEPWLSFFDPGVLSKELHQRTFEDVEDLGLPQLAARYFSQLAAEVPFGPGLHVVRARLIG